MRTIFCIFLATLMMFTIVSEVSAKRFGGGRSFGVQRSAHSYSNFGNKSFNQRSNASRWGGMLGGLLVGGLLASLFMGNGLANGIFSWLIVAGIILFIISLWRKKMQPQYQSVANNSPFVSLKNFSGQSASNNNFDTDSFLRTAKTQFIRLQTAYDQKNQNDLRTFTSPEVFAEVMVQLQESDAYSKTEVISLEAELLEAPSIANQQTASVQFTGYIKENAGAMEPLREIWHFRPSLQGQDWIVCGLQQNN